MRVQPPAGSTWIGLADSELPVAEAQAWVATPDCGAVVTFTGVVRDHSEGRSGVTSLTYEAYEGPAQERMQAVADEARRRWPDIGRVAVLHRVGELGVGQPAVVVAVASPHRGAAFEAAEFCIDTVKASVPLWKRENWAGGSAWGTCATELVDLQAGAPVTALAFLAIAVVISLVGCGVLYLRSRQPTSLESGIDAFKREMTALSPDEPSQPRAPRPPRPDDDPRQG